VISLDARLSISDGINVNSPPCNLYSKSTTQRILFLKRNNRKESLAFNIVHRKETIIKKQLAVDKKGLYIKKYSISMN